MQEDTKTALINEILAYRNRVIKICQNRIYSQPDPRTTAEDLAQIVLVKAVRSIHTFREGSKVSAWLTKIAINTSIDYLRRTKNRTQSVPLSELVETIENSDPRAQCQSHPAYGNNPEDEYLNRLYLQKFLKELESEERYLLQLLIWGWSFLEIAARLGIPEGTVKSRVHRLRKRLREKLKQ